MPWPKKLVLVRHAESDGNVLTTEERTKCELSTQNYRLTERGRAQAKITGAYLRKRFGEFDHYYTSYYRRAIETLELMYPAVRRKEDPRLAEAQRGVYHSMTREEMAQHMPWELRRKEKEGLYHYRPPGGENWPDIELRIHSFLGTLARDYYGQKVLIVVHGHWLILFQQLIHHFSIAEAVRRYHEHLAPNASITIYGSTPLRHGRSHLHLQEEHLVPWTTQLSPN